MAINKTALDFLKDGNEGIDTKTILNNLDEDMVIDIMKDFAKYHVKEALKTALDEIPYGSSTDHVRYEDCIHILNCYPTENIK